MSVNRITGTGREVVRTTGGLEAGSRLDRDTPGQVQVSTGGHRKREAPGRGTSLGGEEVGTAGWTREGITALILTGTPPEDTATPRMDTATLPMDTAILPTGTEIPLTALTAARMDTGEEEEGEAAAMPGPGSPLRHLEWAALTISIRCRGWTKTGRHEAVCLAMEDSLSKQDHCSALLESPLVSDLSEPEFSNSLEASPGQVADRRDTTSTGSRII